MKKKENKAPEKEPSLVISPLEEIMGERFGRYSKYIIQERALPDARDGLKPVQRRILYAMFHDGNTFDHQHRKSAKTVGLVIGNYHPHGDSSVYDAMVRMSQDWKIRMPLIDMHGNNGSIDDDPAAAMRYTEARLAKIAGTLLEDIDKDTVLFAPNFDDTENEPTVLPARFPVLLVNGATGIAAGYATNIPPHNLSEVIDAAIYRMQRPKCSLEERGGSSSAPARRSSRARRAIRLLSVKFRMRSSNRRWSAKWMISGFPAKLKESWISAMKRTGLVCGLSLT